MATKPNNKLRERLAAGRTALGIGVQSNSPVMVEAAGYAGIDFLRVDMEHNWRQDDSLENMIRAAIVSGVTPIIRVDRDNLHLVRKVLELGAEGVVVTHVSTVDYVEQVVRAARFPPRGNRGYTNLSPAGRWGAIPGAELVRWSNAEPMVGVMIENVAAVEAIDGIMAVDGLDFVFFGPSDFSFSLGFEAPDPWHPRVADAFRRTVAAARAAGKHVLYSCNPDAEEIARCRDAGVTMIELGHDVTILQSYLTAQLAALRPGERG